MHTRTVHKSRTSIFFLKEDEHNCKHIFSVIESLKRDATYNVHVFVAIIYYGHVLKAIIIA